MIRQIAYLVVGLDLKQILRNVRSVRTLGLKRLVHQNQVVGLAKVLFSLLNRQLKLNGIFREAYPVHVRTATATVP